MPSQSAEFPVRLKDPGSHEDFSADWTDYLEAINDGLSVLNSVTISPVVTPNGLVLLAPPNPPGGNVTGINGNVTFAWLSGGLAGKSYIVTFSITTTGGRTTEQSMRIEVKNL